MRTRTTTTAQEIAHTYAPADSTKIASSKDSFEFLKPLYFDAEIESFHLLVLNRANKVKAHKVISTGGVSGTVADPKVIFKYALEHLGSGIIISHNHPSGNRTASQSDIELTKKVKEAGKWLEIQVLDHIIMCGDKYLSFADEGMM